MTRANSGHQPKIILSQLASASSPTSWEDPRLSQALEEYQKALERNEVLDRQQFLDRYANVAEELAACLDVLDFVQAAAPKFTPPREDGDDRTQAGQVAPSPGILGDFQIVKEIGRGGMGVVYEAQQISLARRVALKVLPFAAVMDPRQLARFKNEAQAAATLDHPHIVSVHAIGCDRSVHYFAMQYIAGQTLAEVIRDLREREGLGAADHPDGTISYLLTGGFESRSKALAVEKPSPPTLPSAPTLQARQAAISTQRVVSTTAFFHNTARLGIQAAEALDHAHQNGILHRDVKPGNLMLDAAGKLWVTDFGLARIEGNTGMTMTGDLVGTLRYMSPEQALAKRVVVDHRSDIYSLGATLYELLTLRPAFAGEDRQELLRQIAFEEPKPLRKHDRAIPAELETIVLKAMAKDPRDRYATAQELADDLRRFLEHQPIRARRPSLFQRARKWSRRHRAVVTTATVVTICALLVGAGLLLRERNQTLASLEREMEQRLLAQENAAEAQAQRKLAQTEAERAEANFQQARQTVDNYFTKVSESVLFEISGSQKLRQELLQTAVDYYETFVKQHADDPGIQVELAAAHFRLAHVYLSTGSGNWINHARRSIELVEHVSPHRVDTPQWISLRQGLWRFWAGDDSTLYYGDTEHTAAVSRPLEAAEVIENAIRVWERLVQENQDVPGFENDLGGWHALRGYFLGFHLPGRRSEAVDSIRHAIQINDRLRRQFPHEEAYRFSGTHCHRTLSQLIFDSSPEESAKEFGIAAQLLRELESEHPDVVKYRAALDHLYGIGISGMLPWNYLPGSGRELAGPALNDFIKYVEGRASNAVTLQECRWVADFANKLAWFLCDSLDPQFRDPARAIGIAGIALDFAPRNGAMWGTLGTAYYHADQWGAAVDALTKAIELDPADIPSWQTRGEVFAEYGRWNDAASDFAKVAELKPDVFRSWYCKSLVQLTQGDIKGYRETCTAMLQQFAEPKDANSAHFTAWSCVLADNAVDNFSLPVTLAERTVEFAPKNLQFLLGLGAVLYRAGRFDESLAKLQESDSLLQDPSHEGILSPAYIWLFLAMAHHRLGNDEEAKQWYEKAAALASDCLGPADREGTAESSVHWNRRVTLTLLNAEAEHLLGLTTTEATQVQRGEP